VKYLPDFGWKPAVFIPENPSYPLTDETLCSEVPADLEVIKSPIWEPYQLAELFGKQNKKFKAGQFDVGKKQSWKSKISIWIRGNFFIPDARVFWVRPSVKKLKKYLAEHPVEVLVTTGPPHSMHLIGLQLKKDFPDLRWVADFRDPWTEISYYKHLKLTAAADRKHRRLEKQVFQKADLTLATSYSDAENFRNLGANAYCITNGFDGSPYKKGKEAHSEKFTICYAGVLEQLRNPGILWSALQQLADHNLGFKEDLKIVFAGRADEHILHDLKNSSLSDSVETPGYLPHQQANDQMRKADLLLLTNFPQPTSRGIIPGKLFEYLASGTEIISFGPAESDVARILLETKAGRHFSYSEEQKVSAFILQQYERWKRREELKEKRHIDQFSRNNLTEQLAELLNTLTS